MQASISTDSQFRQAVDVMRSAGRSVRMVVDKCEPSYDAMSDSMTSVQSSVTFGKHFLLLPAQSKISVHKFVQGKMYLITKK